MADISIQKEHGMEFADAKAKVFEVVSSLQEKMDVISSVDWNGDKTAAKVKGTGFNGEFAVDEKAVSVDINLKLFVKPLKGKIAAKVERQLERHFG